MEPRLLCFQMNDRQKTILAGLCASMRVSLRQVPASQFGQTIAALSGESGLGPSAAPTVPFRESMVVLCGFSQTQFHMLLDGMKSAGCFSDTLKAVTTQQNMGWTAIRLHEELLRERDAIRSGMSARNS